MGLTSTQIVTILGLIVLSYSMCVTLRVGLFSVAPAGLAGVSAYVAGILMLKSGWSMWPAMLVGTAGGGLVAAGLALPLARISGLYTSIATMAVVVVATGGEDALKVTGGPLGLLGVPYHNLEWLLGVTIAVVVALAFWVDRSDLGRRLDVVGEDPVLATVLGIPVTRVRSIALVVSGLLAGWVGAIFATSFYVVTPTQFNFYFAITVAATAVVGGSGFWIGPLIGAALLGYLNARLVNLANWGDIIIGVVMVAVIVRYPEGIAGPLRKRFRRRFGRGSSPTPRSNRLARSQASVPELSKGAAR